MAESSYYRATIFSMSKPHAKPSKPVKEEHTYTTEQYNRIPPLTETKNSLATKAHVTPASELITPSLINPSPSTTPDNNGEDIEKLIKELRAQLSQFKDLINVK